MKFRKKPIEIEAVRWDGTAHALVEIAKLCGTQMHKMVMNADHTWFEIDTLEGKMRASLGDWIIKGIAGEFYPCKPDIFEATYEPV